MVKGTSKRVIVVKSPDPRVFEEAIFIIREDFINRTGVSSEDIMAEAQQAASSYIHKVRRKKKRSFLHRVPTPFAAAAGAAATGLAWLAVRFVI